MADDTTTADKPMFSFSFSLGNQPDTEALMEEKTALLKKVAALDKKIAKKRAIPRRKALLVKMAQSKQKMAALEGRRRSAKKAVDQHIEKLEILQKRATLADGEYTNERKAFAEYTRRHVVESGHNPNVHGGTFFANTDCWHWCYRCHSYTVKTSTRQEDCSMCGDSCIA